MITTCQPLPQSVIEEMLQVAARAICDRPGDSAHQRASRTRQMVYAILGFEPRDGLEYMLATLVVGHFQLILDSMHEALWGQMDSMKAKTKTGIVSLDRMMLGFVKELRLIRHRPLVRRAEDAQNQADATAAPGPVKTPDWVAAWAGVPPSAPDPNTPDPKMPAPETPAPKTTAAPVAATVPTGLKPDPAPVRGVMPPAQGQTPVHTGPVHGPAAHVQGRPDGDATEQQVAAFEAALAGLTESLEAARTAGGAKTAARAASGD